MIAAILLVAFYMSATSKPKPQPFHDNFPPVSYHPGITRAKPNSMLIVKVLTIAFGSLLGGAGTWVGQLWP